MKFLLYFSILPPKRPSHSLDMHFSSVKKVQPSMHLPTAAKSSCSASPTGTLANQSLSLTSPSRITIFWRETLPWVSPFYCNFMRHWKRGRKVLAIYYSEKWSILKERLRCSISIFKLDSSFRYNTPLLKGMPLIKMAQSMSAMSSNGWLRL